MTITSSTSFNRAMLIASVFFFGWNLWLAITGQPWHYLWALLALASVVIMLDTLRRMRRLERRRIDITEGKS